MTLFVVIKVLILIIVGAALVLGVQHLVKKGKV
jgi:hypothetical protein